MKWYKISDEQMRDMDKIYHYMLLPEQAQWDTMLEQVRQQPLPEPSGEVEKWQWGYYKDRQIIFRKKYIPLEKAFDLVLQELADAKAEISRLRKLEVDKFDLTREQPPEPLVCSGCGCKKDYGKWINNNHMICGDNLGEDDYVCGHAIPLSEFKKGEKK